VRHKRKVYAESYRFRREECVVRRMESSRPAKANLYRILDSYRERFQLSRVGERDWSNAGRHTLGLHESHYDISPYSQ
jgi:hypothetical protein